ncbi:MAG: GIY-YIG nuclease family protein [Quinella sp. 1Q5]|nr:GIY-YIG nuclease family protein [Quinella sp. 1Q5]
MEDNSKPSGESQSAVGVIYKITNTLNGKPYVGKTKRSTEVRFKEHVKEKTYIGKAMRKYGIESFTVEVLEECPVEKLNEREIFWIATLGSKAPNGYNLTDGGDGGDGGSGKGRSQSAETRAKISAKLKGKPSPKKGVKLSAEARANMSTNHADFSGEKHPFFGKHHSPETCARLAAANTGKKHTPEELAKMRGRKHTPEELVKMSVARKAWWARKKAVENNGGT